MVSMFVDGLRVIVTNGTEPVRLHSVACVGSRDLQPSLHPVTHDGALRRRVLYFVGRAKPHGTPTKRHRLRALSSGGRLLHNAPISSRLEFAIHPPPRAKLRWWGSLSRRVVAEDAPPSPTNSAWVVVVAPLTPLRTLILGPLQPSKIRPF